MPGLLLAQSNIAVDGLRPASVVTPTGFGLTLSRGTPTAGAPSGEPTFNAGIDTMLLSDGFESFANKTALLTYDFGVQRWLTGDGSNIQFPSPDGGHAGTKAMRINYPAQASYNDQGDVLEGGILNTLASKPQYGVCQIWVKTKAGYPWRRLDGAGEKSIILNQGAPIRFVLGGGGYPGGSPWGDAYLSAFPDPGFVLSFDSSGVAAGTLWYVQNMNKTLMAPLVNANDGNWHRWTIKYTPGTVQTSTTGDGKIEMWIDGIQVMKYDGADGARAEHNQVLVPLNENDMLQIVDVGGPFNGGPSTSQGDQWKDYDDLAIWVRR